MLWEKRRAAWESKGSANSSMVPRLECQFLGGGLIIFIIFFVTGYSTYTYAMKLHFYMKDDSSILQNGLVCAHAQCRLTFHFFVAKFFMKRLGLIDVKTLLKLFKKNWFHYRQLFESSIDFSTLSSRLNFAKIIVTSIL